MNPLVKKEIRLLLPCCLISLVLTFANWLVPPNPHGYWEMFLSAFPFLLCPAMVVMLALDSFGVEISSGIFTSLLAQPVPRRQIWRIKSMLLLAAIVIILLAWWYSFFLSGTIHFWISEVNIREVMLGTGLFAMVVYSGGLWTVLLLRQVAAAFWFTLIVPAALLTISTFFLQDTSDRAVELVAVIVLTAYSAAGFFFARWLFLRAQDVDWTGGTIALPELRWLRRRSEPPRDPQAVFDIGSPAASSHRTWRPKAALFGKELQLHSVTLFFAGALLVLHIGVFFLRIYYANSHRNSLAEGVSDFFWMLWLVLPLTIGCAAVAEEWKLGVVEGQFCLPISRRWQFAIKFIPAMIFGTLLGGIMPVLLETVARHLGWHNNFDFGSMGFRIAIIALSAGFSLAAFVASTFVRNFLQALSLAVVIVIGCFWFGSFIAHTVEQRHLFSSIMLWPHSLLPFVIAIPTIVIMFLWLVFRNFSHFHERGSLWRGNLLGIIGALLFVVVSSAAIYNRPWEIFEAAEPGHGPAKFSLANPPKFQNCNYGNLLVRLPDGRVWFDSVGYSFDEQPSRLKYLWMTVLHPSPKSTGPQQFIGGSNWVSVTACRIDRWHPLGTTPLQAVHTVGYLDTVGIRPDGTLWISSESKPEIWTGAKMVRFGDETNWQQVTWSYGGMLGTYLLLKTDGTLWHWETAPNDWNFDWSTFMKNWPSVRTFKPQQIGTNSDWKEVWPGYARKIDGTAWRINGNPNDEWDKLQRDINLDRPVSPTLSGMNDNAMAYVAMNGTLWVCNRYWDERTGIGEGTGLFLQAGKGTNWVAVAGGWNGMVVLKSDGSLWKWNLPSQPMEDITKMAPTRLGIHNDWVGLTSTWVGVASLAADGSLWHWPGTGYPEVLMKAPKQPQLLGNIFSDPPEVAAIREGKGQP